MSKYTLGLFANMYPSDEKDSKGIFIKRMVDDLEESNVRVIKAVKTIASPLAYSTFYYKSFIIALNNQIEIFQAEYIPHSSLIPSLLKFNRPLILRFHGDDARIFPFKSPLHKAVIQWMIQRSNYIITVSEEMRHILIGMGADPDRSAAIAVGVNTGQFIPMTKNTCHQEFNFNIDRMIFLFIGRYHPWKGIHELIEAAKALPEDVFIFAGAGILPVHPENCIDIGEVEPEKIPILINAANCLVLPSYTEGLPTVLMEALSCAVPVIATNVGGCPEVVKNNITGLLIPPKNIPALCNALIWMKEHPDERNKMGERGREDMINRYDRKYLISKMVHIHRKILEERP
ncbi:glycosyltransferase family 4 protein [Methanocalculus taiwanensis]|uniref:Glycosyltransferase family 4 protein n=1 Tax=Methanocalculus taiwanensis TaxID=106207 RepID=A0ABD4THN0_9EURY|nr:glycosyltransferase family 4 protein [Methanocalculus taiwanensis]MCQ1538453.1 glycosyltransferase family 4 protein [Methanocalculus taiwanensis]